METSFLQRFVLGALPLILLSLLPPPAARAADVTLDYSRDIRPILSDNCFACHGPDANKRKAELRLDLPEAIKGKAKSGKTIVVPGDAAGSLLVQMITHPDPEKRMPAAASRKTLSQNQIDKIKLWITQGAVAKGHWAYIKPTRPPLPAVKPEFEKYVRNPIDRFVIARLQREGLSPSVEADRYALARRVTSDLTGMPATPAEVDEFVNDKSPDAYERLVDRLLKNPRYGEHAARYWLDAARYGDTHGLHLDNERAIWPYRDWVIKAMNENKRFDVFTIEQLAGDLLPDSTLDQKIATGFLRSNVTTSEGGSIDEEYYVRYAVDRTETVATVWMAMTATCMSCHNHKYDPMTQKEFYQMYAFFNSVGDKAMDGNAMLPPPFIKAPQPHHLSRKQELEKQVAQVQSEIAQTLAKATYTEPEAVAKVESPDPAEFVWVEDDLPAGAKPAGEGPTPWRWVGKDTHPVFSGERASRRRGKGINQHLFTAASQPLKIGKGDKLFAYVYLDPTDPPKSVQLQYNDGSWEHRAHWGADVVHGKGLKGASFHRAGDLPPVGKWTRLEVDAQTIGLKPGAIVNGMAFTQFDGVVNWDKAGIVTRTPQDGGERESLALWEKMQKALGKPALPAPVLAAIKTDPAKRTDEQKKAILHHYLENVHAKSQPLFAPLHKKMADLRAQIKAVDDSIPATLIAQELEKPRVARILERGEYDRPREEVSRGTPAVLPGFPEKAPKNRLGFAQWLVDPSHPLTARVTINRYWQQLFGVGIVKTAEEFGSQGEWPSHPDLMDWLAVEFIESGWDVKAMMKLMVMSGAYRQSSAVLPAHIERDAENRLLARGPRFRMDAEVLRDNALSIGGLLVEKIGGPSVRPYQPPNIWNAVSYVGSNTMNYVQDKGDKLYRRSMYTFWKRTAPPAALMIMDAPSREACTVKRSRTNTPLAALAMMNDIQFVEAARALGQRMIKEGGKTPAERAAFGFRLAVARPPQPAELKVILEQYEAQLAVYKADPKGAAKLIAVGESKPDPAIDPVDLAAWTMVGNVLLNLDETVSKR